MPATLFNAEQADLELTYDHLTRGAQREQVEQWFATAHLADIEILADNEYPGLQDGDMIMTLEDGTEYVLQPADLDDEDLESNSDDDDESNLSDAANEEVLPEEQFEAPEVIEMVLSDPVEEPS